jgi:hypothetical protein
VSLLLGITGSIFCALLLRLGGGVESLGDCFSEPSHEILNNLNHIFPNDGP